MILICDSYYTENLSINVGLLIDEEENIKEEYITHTEINDEYIPGQFYKRELPGILSILELIDHTAINLIIVDGYVFLTPDRKGLGHHLYEHLDQKIPVIGVAKKFYVGTEATEVFRGKSSKPLYITSAGIDMDSSCHLIKTMKGDYRMPDILKELDQKTKLKQNLKSPNK